MVMTEKTNIKGVIIKKLNVNTDERGNFIEILRDDENLLRRFSQVSVSSTKPGVLKAFHMHEKQDEAWCVLKGNVQVALYDTRKGSPTRGKLYETMMGAFFKKASQPGFGVCETWGKHPGGRRQTAGRYEGTHRLPGPPARLSGGFPAAGPRHAGSCRRRRLGAQCLSRNPQR